LGFLKQTRSDNLPVSVQNPGGQFSIGDRLGGGANAEAPNIDQRLRVRLHFIHRAQRRNAFGDTPYLLETDRLQQVRIAKTGIVRRHLG